LALGDEVTVRSASGGGWCTGRITDVSQTRVKVQYAVQGELCEKILLRSSPNLKEQPVASTSAGSPAPAPRFTHSAIGEALGSGPTPEAPRHWRTAQTPSSSPIIAASPNNGVRQVGHMLAGAVRMADLHFGELLGSGGFGAVHRGTLHGEAIAIKKLHIEGGHMTSEQLAEIEKEVANLKALKHERLIRFIDVVHEPPMLCIVTELASGGSLYSLLHVQHAQLSQAQRRTLVLQIIEGVEFLHTRQPPCVHRDLKSANVVLDADLGAKLCDFGLTESMEKTHLSRRETEGGSPRYMAPEVFDARGRLTEKLDIWALGCLIAEVLIIKVPHDDCSSIQQVAAKLLVRLQPPFGPGWSEGIHLEVSKLVEMCFIHDATSRPSAGILLDGLSRMASFWINEL